MATEESVLKKFLLDINKLDVLNQYVTSFNYFDVLKISRTEIRHSNVLAWLMDPTEEHGLDGAFLKEIINYLVRTGYLKDKDSLKWLIANCNNFCIFREYQNIDILAVNDKDELVICIENKVDSTDRENQLNKYSKTILEKYNNYKTAFIYLTVEGSKPVNETEEDWALISYSYIYDILVKLTKKLNDRIDKKTLFFIEDYLNILRREFVNSEEIEKICDSIYREHKDALNLIFNNRPDRVKSLVEHIEDWCEEKDKAHEIIFCKNVSNKSYTRFHTKALNNLIGESKTLSDWGTKYHYYYEINASYQKNGSVKYRMLLSFNSRNLKDKEIKKLESIAKKVNKNKIKDNWVWMTVHSTTTKVIKEGDDIPTREEVFEELDKFWEKMKLIDKKFENI